MVLVKEAWRTFVTTPCQQDLYSVINPITWICRVSGIFPLILEGPVGQRKYSPSYVLIIYSLIVLVLSVTGLCTCTDHTNERRLKISYFAVVRISIQFELILEIVSMIVMITSAILSREKFINAIHSMSLQDISLQKLGIKLDYAADYKRGYIQLGIIILVVAILCVYDFAYQFHFNVAYPLNWISWVYPNVIRIASACLFVDILVAQKQRFGALNENLNKIIEETKDYSQWTASGSGRICERIRSIATIHGALCEIALSVSQTFGFNIIVGVIYALIILTTSMYYTFEEMKDLNCNYLQLFGSLNWGLISCIHIIYIVMACRFTQDEADLTGKLIHKIPISKDDTAFNNVIQSFSLQMHHEKIKFSGAGLFPLDATLIQSIVGAVTTYLVILIQFEASMNEAIASNREFKSHSTELGIADSI